MTVANLEQKGTIDPTEEITDMAIVKDMYETRESQGGVDIGRKTIISQAGGGDENDENDVHAHHGAMIATMAGVGLIRIITFHGKHIGHDPDPDPDPDQGLSQCRRNVAGIKDQDHPPAKEGRTRTATVSETAGQHIIEGLVRTHHHHATIWLDRTSLHTCRTPPVKMMSTVVRGDTRPDAIGKTVIRTATAWVGSIGMTEERLGKKMKGKGKESESESRD